MLLYFRGCTAREKLTSISKATERILKIAKIDYENAQTDYDKAQVALDAAKVNVEQEIEKNRKS